MASLTHKGDIGELSVSLDLIKHGFIVSKPITQDARYDLIADDNGKLYRVQCKSTTSDGKKVIVRCRHTDSSYQYRYTDSMIDILASFDTTTGLVHYIPASALGARGRNQLDIRITTPKNNQSRKVNSSVDFRNPRRT